MKFSRRFLPALAVAGALLVAGCGDTHDPGSGHRSSATSAGGVDRAFVAEMIPHHESAVAMATIAQDRGSSVFVKQLADDIVRSQTQEIATMRAADQRLKGAGAPEGSLGVPDHMTGMDGDTSALNTANPFDRAFLRMMLPHHEGALVMARVELAKGNDAELKTLARDIISAQQREIREMRKQLGGSGNDGRGHTGGRDAGHPG